VLLEVQATNLHHIKLHHQAAVSLVVMMLLLSLLAVVLVQADMKLHLLHSQVVLMLLSFQLEVSTQAHTNHQQHKFNNMLPMLKVSSLTETHKSSVVLLLVVFKLIHKTFEFDSFNHHQYHPQA